MALTPLVDAIDHILGQIAALSKTETIGLSDALGRVMAHDFFATMQVPPMDNSAMDGYALDVEGMADGEVLAVSQRIPAGAVAQALQPGTAARIFTGAEVPAGANAVVMQENTEVVEGGVKILICPRQGDNIRLAGNDIDIGQCIVTAGQRLRAQDIGLLASLGVAQVEVVAKPNVALLCTGDELVQPGDPLGPGQIYNSNQYMLASLLKGWGCEVETFASVEDDLESVKTALSHASRRCDLIISSGGVSVGEEDHVRAAVEELGHLSMWRLAIKPGKPVAFGAVADIPFLGLPGNPSSSFVTALLVARPLLMKLAGVQNDSLLEISVTADFDWPHAGSREEYLRVKLIRHEGEFRASAYDNQSSGALMAASWGNALARITLGSTVAKGDSVKVLLFDSLLS